MSFSGELAPADCLWTTKAGGAVKSRISDTNKEIPTETVHSAIARAVKNFPNNIALATKRNGVWMKWTYTEYYSDVRSAAKGFLKVIYSTVCVQCSCFVCVHEITNQ